MTSERRVDPFLGTPVHVVTARQDRPNLPSDECPFCVGGREAPDQYSVRAFPNRWPALAEGRCEVVLYTPEHDASFSSLGAEGARQVIDLWADRTTALSALDDVEFVLIFENRGAEVGATISHPHGQIYAFDHVPPRPDRRFAAGWRPDAQATDRSFLNTRVGRSRRSLPRSIQLPCRSPRPPISQHSTMRRVTSGTGSPKFLSTCCHALTASMTLLFPT